MAEHHSILCNKLFDAIVDDPNHKLHVLLPHKNNAFEIIIPLSYHATTPTGQIIHLYLQCLGNSMHLLSHRLA